MTSAAYHQITQTITPNWTRTHRFPALPGEAATPDEERELFLSASAATGYTANPDGTLERTHSDGARVRIWWETPDTPLHDQVFNPATIETRGIIATTTGELVVTAVDATTVTARPILRPRTTVTVPYADITAARTHFGC